MSTVETSTLSTTINASFETVVKDLANAESHPLWANKFFSGAAKRLSNGEYEVNVPVMGGTCRYKVAANFEYGLIDIFIAPAGAEFGPPIPVRVIRNGSGVDVLWTLARFPGTPDQAWQGGLAAMREELAVLKSRLEGGMQ